MASAISQALDSLLPSQQPPPQKLTQLANALLAQSRLRASHLKPEEEIARQHACAEIACNRLRRSLRLPPTSKGRPPCKPTVYKKLLSFLEGVLVEQRSTRAENVVLTPRKRGADGQPKVVTSTPTTTTTKGEKDAFTGKIVSSAQGSGVNEGEAPDWVMPLVRKLCQAFNTLSLPPHVYTGACVVLKLAEMWPPPDNENEQEFKRNASTLVIALYLLVLTRMQKNDMTTTAYTTKCAKAVEIAEIGEPAESMKRVESWIKRTNREDWCTGQDWWASVPEGVIELPDEEDSIGVDRNLEDEDEIMNGTRRKKMKSRLTVEELEQEDPDGVLLPGLGTMMQDAVDWLGEDRRLNYLQWEEDVLRKIRSSEHGEGRSLTVR